MSRAPAPGRETADSLATRHLEASRHRLLQALLRAPDAAAGTGTGTGDADDLAAPAGPAAAHSAPPPAVRLWAASLSATARVLLQPPAQRHPLALLLGAAALGAGACAVLLHPGARRAAGWLLTRLPPRLAWAGVSLVARQVAWDLRREAGRQGRPPAAR